MPNLLNQNIEKIPLSWLQSNNGEWQYFVDKKLVKGIDTSIATQDYIWLVSQAKSNCKVSGYRVTNQTIENIIEQLEGVNQALVFGVPHEHKGNAIHVYIELSQQEIDLSTLSNAINAKMASGVGEFLCADVIKFVSEFPIEKNKQVSRKNLKSQSIILNNAA